MEIYFWWEVLSLEIQRAITEVAGVDERVQGSMGEVTGGFSVDKHWIERQIATPQSS